MPPQPTPAEIDTQLESDPSAMGSWMKALPTLEQEPAKAAVGAAAAAQSEPERKVDKSAQEPPAAKPAEDKAAQEKAAAEAAEKEKAAKAAAAPKEKEKLPEPGEEKWPRTSADWDKFKAVRKERETKLQAEIAARDAKIKEYEAKAKELEETAAKVGQGSPETQAQIERYQKENEELSKRLQIVDVTQHPKFQAYFKNKVDAQMGLAKNILGTEKAAAFEKAMSLPPGEYKDAQIEELVSDLPTLQQTRIGGVLNSLEEINAERESEIQKAKDHQATLANQTADKQKQTAAARDKLFTDVIKSVQDEKLGMAVYQKRDGDDAWNRGIDERIATAKKLLVGQDVKPEDIVKAALHAAAMPVILEAYQSDMKEKDEAIASLESQVKELTAAQPAKGGSAAAAAGNENTQNGKPISIGMNPQEAIASFTKGMWQEQP